MDSGKNTVLSTFLHTHQITHTERRILVGRSFERDVATYLVEGYADDTEFQLAMVPNYDAIQRFALACNPLVTLEETDLVEYVAIGAKAICFHPYNGRIDDFIGPHLRRMLAQVLDEHGSP
jgi:hypothetical protein